MSYQHLLLNQYHQNLNRGVVFSDDTDLKAYWKFDEASGDIIEVSQAAAALGSAADLQVSGATHGATGIIGDALSFITDDFVQAGTSEDRQYRAKGTVLPLF